LKGDQEENISALEWISVARLLIGGIKGSVRLWEHDGHGALRRMWSATVPEGVPHFTLDGDYVWVGQRSLYRLKLADGVLDATIKPAVTIRGTAACHGSLLVWDAGGVGRLRVHHGLDGFKTYEEFLANEAKVGAHDAPQIHVWTRDPTGQYVRRARLSAGRIASVLPLDSPLCLLIPAEGGCEMLLDLDKGMLSNAALEITPLPPPPLDPNLATTHEIKALLDLARQVPVHDRVSIFDESRKKSDLTPRKRIYWLTEQLRHYIETKKPGPVDLARELAEQEDNNATAEQIRTSTELFLQIPRAEANAINAEAAKKTELTPRQRTDWVIKQYRKYLEHHKPMGQDKKQPAEEKNAEESSGRPAGGNQ